MATHYCKLLLLGYPALLADHCRLIEQVNAQAAALSALQTSNAQLRHLLDLPPITTAPRNTSAANEDKTAYHHKDTQL